MKPVKFLDNDAARTTGGKYVSASIDVAAVLDSWKGSLFAFEWMHTDGRLKTLDELPLLQREQRLEVELKLNEGQALEKPVLGIGMLDTIEIGSGKATLLTLGAHNIDKADVYIPSANQDEFKSFISA